MAGPIGGMVLGAMAAPAGAGLGATLAAGAKGALGGAGPIGAALSGAMGGGGAAGALTGAAKAVGASNPIMSAVMSGAQNGFVPSPASAAADLGVKAAPVVQATPTQSGGGAADPKALWGDMHNVGFNDAQSAALLGNMKQESGFRPGVVNPGEGAQGLIQWRGNRLANLQQFAQAQGKSYTDPGVQVQFLKHEMQTTESGPGSKFLAAQTPQEANAALKGYIRYGSPPDKGGIVTRQQNTDNYYRQFTGMPITAGVSPLTPATGTAPVASGAGATPAPTTGQRFAQALKDVHAKAAQTPVAQPEGAVPVQGGNIAGQRQIALMSPALQMLEKLKQQVQTPSVPAIGGKSPVTV